MNENEIEKIASGLEKMREYKSVNPDVDQLAKSHPEYKGKSQTRKLSEWAYSKLREAIKSGKIQKPKCCSRCHTEIHSAQLHGHHHNSYARWWDVVWLCARCHVEIEPLARPIGKRAGVHTHPESRPYGEINGNSKLTTEKVNMIRARSNELSAVLASEFGMSQSQIRKIIIGKQWSHIKK